MIVAPYQPGRDYDVLFEQVIKGIKKKGLQDKDDDFLLLFVGGTGSGKSNLMLHAYELFDPEGCSVKAIGLDRKQHAQSLKYAQSQSADNRFCGSDEANISRRDSMTKYNKDLIDLYMAIRGLNIFHAWCNPSVDMLDKYFIEERVKGLIFIANKDMNKPRVYYYFTKKGLIKLLEKNKDLKLKTLKRYAKEFAKYRGWFRAYKGKLLKEYLDKKGSRMSVKLDEHFEKYGREDVVTKVALAKYCGVTDTSIRRYEEELLSEGLLEEGVHYYNDPRGKKVYLVPSKDVFRELSIQKLKSLSQRG